MTPDDLVNLPDAERAKVVLTADTPSLREALTIATARGSAYSAADIAFELGRRVSEGDVWDNDSL